MIVQIKNYRQLVDYLKENKFTIATAESCTGGLIAKLITDVAGSSEVFIGGIVSYSNEMKKKWLAVKETTLFKFGAVSKQTVVEMLEGIHHETGATFCIAVSGIAGPGGGTREKPVGTVFIGVRNDSQTVVEEFHFAGSRENIRNSSAQKIIEMIQNLAFIKSSFSRKNGKTDQPQH